MKNMKKTPLILFAVIVLLVALGFGGWQAYKLLFSNRDLELLGYSPQSIKSINEKDLKDVFIEAGHSELMIYAFQNNENAIDEYEYYLIPDGSFSSELSTEYIYNNVRKLQQKEYSANNVRNIIMSLPDSSLRYIVEKDKPENIAVFIDAIKAGFSNDESYTLANGSDELWEKISQGTISIDTINQLLEKGYVIGDINSILLGLGEEDVKMVLSMKHIPNLAKFLDSNLDFKLSLLPRYLIYIKYHDASIEEAMNTVNADKDVLAKNQIDFASFYISDPFVATNPNSYTVLVNKENRLPADYEPADLVYLPDGYYGNNHPMRSVAANALISLSDAAVKAGYQRIIGQSNYRSYGLQETLYNNYVRGYGQKEADVFSARPGFSDHQTGLVSDIATATIDMESFDTYSGYKWVLDHAHEFGFIQRYPKNKEYITGYEFESWHFRYVGVEAATMIHKFGWTLEEYKMVFD